MPDKYIIDANAFIAPYNNFYPFDLLPSFWNQMKKHIECGNIAILDLVKDEIEKHADDDLSNWLKNVKIKTFIKYNNQETVPRYSEIMKYIEECGFYITDKALSDWDQPSADPWLIAASRIYGYKLVTFEQSAGRLSKKNKSKRAKIPDVCKHFGVECCNLYEMMRALSFKL
jgi:hypothetical protein